MVRGHGGESSNEETEVKDHENVHRQYTMFVVVYQEVLANGGILGIGQRTHL